MKRILLLLLCCAITPVYAVNLQVQIQDYYNPLAQANGQHVFITSKEDNVKINNVVINRGNCRIGTPARNYRVTLGFGQKIRVTPLVGCTVMEIKIDTDKGSETYSVQ